MAYKLSVGGVANQGKSSIFSDVVKDPDRFYGDMENDHFAIKKGIDWYYEDYPNSKTGINGPLP